MTGGTAWLFPGQGTDLGALAPEALDRPGPVRRLLDVAAQLVGVDLSAAIRAGHPMMWKTELAQPALVAVTLGLAFQRAGEETPPQVVAGHSLGELAAVAFAGCLTAEEAIGAAAARGRLMAAAAREFPGGMVAISCANAGEVETLLARGRDHGALSVAARNSPTQWVVSGERAALAAVLAMAAGTTLRVPGPWHSAAMTGAAAAWEPILRALRWQRPALPLALAGRASMATYATDLAGELVRQLTTPVLWLETVESLLAAGVARFVSVGPGRALKGLCREIIDARWPGEAAGGREVRVS